MENQDIYLQQALLNELSVTSTDTNDQDHLFEVDLDVDDASSKFLDIQDLILQQVPEGKTKSITIENQDKEIAHIDISPLANFKTKLEELQLKMQRLSEVEDAIESIEDLTNTYKQTHKQYEEKLDNVESMINQKFGLVDNTINKQKNLESHIKPSTFRDINKKYGLEIKNYLKRTYTKLFQGKADKTPVEQQSMNNALSAKLKLRENLIKEFKNTRSTANPDQIAEELLLSLLRPIKAVSNSLHQYSTETKELSKKQKNIVSQTGPEKTTLDSFKIKPEVSIKLNGTEYAFQGYSGDYSNLLLKDASGKSLQMMNNKGITLDMNTAPKLNPIQQDLLNRGKTLLMTDGKFPYKLSKGENDYLNITTVSISEFTAGKKESQKNSKSIKRSI